MRSWTSVGRVALAVALLLASSVLGAHPATAAPTGRNSADHASSKAPKWNLLLLIYARTEFSFVDSDGKTRRFVGTIDRAQQRTIESVARTFVRHDVPALDSGAMAPSLSVRKPNEALAGLVPEAQGYWPNPASTASRRDPRFDAVIVAYNPVGTDLTTGEPLSLTPAAGLTPNMGTGQAYMAIIAQAFTDYPHRNVLKHEFGHAILSYYSARGTSPSPTVDNHTGPFSYVHCGTSTAYVWEDESNAAAIPNSIYNNQSGFTHDYYSGTTALASDPAHCLGVTPAAWRSGKPTKPRLAS